MKLIALPFAVAAALLVGGPVHAQEAKPAGIFGAWALKEEPASRGEGIRSRTRGPGGYGGGGEAGRFDGGGFGGAWMPPAFRELLRPKATLEIAPQDTVVTVKDDSGWLRYLLPGKGTMREELGQGGPAVVESTWKKDRLVTERRMDTGERYREEYRLDAKHDRLLVEIEFSTPRMQKPLRIRRTYEREAPRTSTTNTGWSPRGGTGSPAS